MAFLKNLGQIWPCDLESINKDGTTQEANSVSTKRTRSTVATNIASASGQ